MQPRESELEMVDRHVRQGQRHIVEQRAIILRFRQDGYDTTEAERLLENMEELQEFHLQHLAHLEHKQA